ncbi:CrcB family protein [Actinomadura sp. PM05-2]|uniref:Fluoride-specific ion channel FluC n=2 Tax=Actinomadura parmotrematis TaxID=2864039 RepID=A0ABS7FZ21_9ACTN|nr:CrcB family protein [Actinomadura parmotrematis]
MDPDVDLHVPRQRAEMARAPWPTLGAVSAGGAIGALGRYGLGQAFPAGPGAFPWATFAINVSGCLLIGVLMAVLAVRNAHPLVRPFLGVGVLGGYTTFSTYVVDVQRIAGLGRPGVALAYLVATPVCALVAVYAGVRGTRRLVGEAR